MAPTARSSTRFATPGSGLRDLGALDGIVSQPTGLNNRGDVVGRIGYVQGPDHAFLWTAAEGMENITAVTGLRAVRRLNDNLQTLGDFDGIGAVEPGLGTGQARARPLLVQLQSTPSNTPPTAQFTWSCHATVCTLDATSSTDDKGIVSYSWTLGKPPHGTASGPTVTVDYWHAGPRYVTLTAKDAEGLTHSVSKQVDVGTGPLDSPPVARFTASVTDTKGQTNSVTQTVDVP